MNRLRREFDRHGRGEAFRCFQPCLQGDPDATRREEMARVLCLSVGAVQVGLTRARHRFAELLHEVVLQTVASPAEVSEEIRHLQVVNPRVPRDLEILSRKNRRVVPCHGSLDHGQRHDGGWHGGFAPVRRGAADRRGRRGC